MAKFDIGQIARLAQYALSTQNRPLRLVLARPGGDVDGLLLPQKVTGHEAVCGGFEFRIMCVAESAQLALKDFMGVPAELQVVTDRGSCAGFAAIRSAASASLSRECFSMFAK